MNRSLAQHALGQAGDAQGSLRRALEIDPHNAAAHYNLARQFEAAGETSAAIDHYKQFIQYASPEQAAYAADVGFANLVKQVAEVVLVGADDQR